MKRDGRAKGYVMRAGSLFLKMKWAIEESAVNFIVQLHLQLMPETSLCFVYILKGIKVLFCLTCLREKCNPAGF